MRKIKLFLSCLLMSILSIGQMWGADVINNAATSAKCGNTATNTWVTNFTISGTSGADYYIHTMGTKNTSNALQWNANGFLNQTKSGGTLKSITIKGTSGKSIDVFAANSAYSTSTPSGTAVTTMSLTGNDVTYTFTSNYTYFALKGKGSSTQIVSITIEYSSGGSDPIAVTGVTLDESAIILEEDETKTLTATVLPNNATEQSVTWESDDETVAKVEEGVVTAVGAGDATITCKSVADETKKAECTVHVNPSPYTKSKLIFSKKYADGGATASDDAEWTVESDGTESSFDPDKGIHYGTGSAEVQYIRLSTNDINGTIARIVVNASTANGVTATASVTIGGDAFGGDAQSLSNSAAEYTFTGSASGEIVVLVTKPSSATKAIYVKSIVVYYIPAPQKTPAGLAYNDADLSNLVKLGASFTAPTLTNPNSLSVTYTSSNTDVAEVAADGALTIKAVGVAEITASSEETDTYKAGSAKYTIYVVAHDGTEADPYTVADARVIIDKVGETGIADKYATGIVSKIVTALNPTYGNITYNISDDGTTTAAQLQAFRGFDKDGEWFTSEDDVIVGDEVVVKGLLKKFGSTYEFDAGNQLVSLNRTKAVADLAYAETAIEKNIGDAAFTNALTNPNNLEVSYSSSATGVATVDENGEVTIVGMGTTTIKATFAGNASYLADEVSYTLTVEDPSLIKVTFDATIDKGESPLSKSNISLSCSNGVLNNASEYRLYKNSTTTFECSAGTIAKIEFIGVSGNPASGFAAPTEGDFVTDGNNATWTGNAASVSFVASGAQVRATKIFVSYREDTRAEAGLEYAETAVVKTVGDDAFINALTNPHSVAVTYESSDTDVAEVANDGTVTIKAQGTTTITASFEGNATYKPASVSYVLTVNEPGLDNVTFDATSDVAGSGELSITKNGFTLTFTGGVMDNSSEYRLYKDQTMTLSSNDYLIKKIEFTCTTDNPISGFADATGLDKANNQWTGEANKVELTASNKQVRMTKIKVFYVEDTRAAAGLAWDPADDIELTVGDALSAPTLLNPNSIDAAEITIESSNTDLATVTAGEVALVADATGTTTITATFAGNDDFKPATVSYKIKVNPAYAIYVSPSLNVNFGSVEQDAEVADKKVTVTFTNVPAATLTLEGAGASAFTISPAAAMTESGDITISASSANLGTFAATLTISDDANNAESKVVNLSITVNEVVTPETPVSTTSQWVPATEIVDGMQVLIVGVNNTDYSAMGVQNNNNRAAVAASVDGEGVLTPGENTMAFTVVEQSDGIFALRTSNGKYLYAASSSSNYLRSQDELDDNGRWTLTVTSAVAKGTYTHKMMQFNSSSSIFACYTTSTTTQKPIALYVPKQDTPEPPTPDYGSYERNGLTPGYYATICLPQAGTIEGATLFEIGSYENNMIYIDEVTGGAMEAGKPYIFQATATELNVTYTSAVVEETAGHANGLYGFYNLSNENATYNIPEDAGNYILYSNQYWLVKGRAAYIANYRAYIKIGAIQSKAAAPGRRRVAMAVNGEQVVTGIDALNASEQPVKMIIDGQLFIIRGEKMYNANGQLVK